MEIYAVENDLKNLLLVDGDYVVNGDYNLYFDGKVAKIPNSGFKAYYVMKAPQGKGYGDILDKAEKIINGRKEN